MDYKWDVRDEREPLVPLVGLASADQGHRGLTVHSACNRSCLPHVVLLGLSAILLRRSSTSRAGHFVESMTVAFSRSESHP